MKKNPLALEAGRDVVIVHLSPASLIVVVVVIPLHCCGCHPSLSLLLLSLSIILGVIPHCCCCCCCCCCPSLRTVTTMQADAYSSGVGDEYSIWLVVQTLKKEKRRFC